MDITKAPSTPFLTETESQDDLVIFMQTNANQTEYALPH